MLIIAQSAKEGTFREHQRLLSAVTTRAKIEQELGLTEQISGFSTTDGHYWPNEAIVSPRHLATRRNYETSELFIQQHERGGYQKVTEQLFHRFQLLGIIMTLLFFSTAAWKAKVSIDQPQKSKAQTLKPR